MMLRSLQKQAAGIRGRLAELTQDLEQERDPERLQALRGDMAVLGDVLAQVTGRIERLQGMTFPPHTEAGYTQLTLL